MTTSDLTSEFGPQLFKTKVSFVLLRYCLVPSVRLIESSIYFLCVESSYLWRIHH